MDAVWDEIEEAGLRGLGLGDEEIAGRERDGVIGAEPAMGGRRKAST